MKTRNFERLLGSRQGFTIVELMIVVVIVGILSAVAVPTYMGAAEKAKTSEAKAALGTIKSSMDLYYVENGTYYNDEFVEDALVTDIAVLNLLDNELDGHYFSSECYRFYQDATDSTFVISCDGSKSTAVGGDQVSSVGITIDQDGEFGTFSP